jgi:hypothetical protein
VSQTCAIEWKGCYSRLVDEVAYLARHSLQERSFRYNLHRLRHGAQLQGNV